MLFGAQLHLTGRMACDALHASFLPPEGADLEHAEPTDASVKAAYLEYLSQYRTALAETQACLLHSCLAGCLQMDVLPGSGDCCGCQVPAVAGYCYYPETGTH